MQNPNDPQGQGQYPPPQYPPPQQYPPQQQYLPPPGYPPPIYVMNQVSPEVEGSSTTALWLEIIFGFFGLLGIGHVYSKRTGIGILLMISWWMYIGVAAFFTTLTLGIAGCITVPLYFAVPILSGIQARTYTKRSAGTGSWSSVGLVAGGGCLFLIISTVVLSVLVLGLGAVSQNSGR